MAYTHKQKRDARDRYVFKRQAIMSIAHAIGVTASTIRRWKREALARHDDWDQLRKAMLVSGQGLESVVASTMEEFVLLTKSTIEDIKVAKTDHVTRVKELVALADAMTKAVSAAGRLTPKLSELGIAQDVLKRLSEFIAGEYPQHADAFLEILEPFGAEIAKAYS